MAHSKQKTNPRDPASQQMPTGWLEDSPTEIPNTIPICSHLANGPWNKSLNIMFPTTYCNPKKFKKFLQRKPESR